MAQEARAWQEKSPHGQRRAEAKSRHDKTLDQLAGLKNKIKIMAGRERLVAPGVSTFDALDTNHDGVISREEWTRAELVGVKR